MTEHQIKRKRGRPRKYNTPEEKKQANREKANRWRAKNKEKSIEACRRYREANPEKFKKYNEDAKLKRQSKKIICVIPPAEAQIVI